MRRVTTIAALIAVLYCHPSHADDIITKASTQAVTDVLDDRLVLVRAQQLLMLADDIEADLEPGETVKLSRLVQHLRRKVRTDDPNWLVWYDQNFGSYLSWTISTAPDKNRQVDLSEAVEAMRTVASRRMPPSNAEELAESEARTAEAFLEMQMRRPNR